MREERVVEMEESGRKRADEGGGRAAL